MPVVPGDFSDTFVNADFFGGRRDQSFTDDFERRKDVDIIAFQLDAGERVRLTTDFAGDSPDTYLALFDRSGNLLKQDDDDGPGLGSKITHTNRGADDIFYVAVSPYGRFPQEDFDFNLKGPDYSGVSSRGQLFEDYILSIDHFF